MRYEDLEVQLGPGSGGRLEVSVSHPIGGQARGPFTFPWPPGQIGAFSYPIPSRTTPLRDLSPIKPSSTVWTSADRIGRALFDALFQGDVRGVLDRSMASLVGVKDRGLRIKLRMNLNNETHANLHELPWELLYRSETGEFLGLNPLYPIVRYLEAPHPTPPGWALDGTFRLLVVAPQPRGGSPLNLEAERRYFEAIQTNLSNFDVQLLKPPTLSALRKALLPPNPEYHALHFMGHGTFDSAREKGFLSMEDDRGEKDEVAAEIFANVLRSRQSLQLVVLNACNSAVGSVENPFSGLAPALVRAGIPVVLAMRQPISDKAAIAFSQTFYDRLSKADPVDTAATEARLAVSIRHRSSDEWAIPALFMRVSDGTIFTEPLWRKHLLAGNYREAAREARQARARNPKDGMATIGLAIALCQGENLWNLLLRDALGIHELLLQGLVHQHCRGLAAACLIALKLDYFRHCGVMDRSPSLEEVLRYASGNRLSEREQELLRRLNMSERTQERIANAHQQQRRS